MDENLHDIDKLFKDTIEPHGEMPGPGVWDAIDKGLDKKGALQLKRKNTNLRRLVAILVLLLCSVVAYELVTYRRANVKEEAEENSTHKNPPVAPVRPDASSGAKQPAERGVINEVKSPGIKTDTAEGNQQQKEQPVQVNNNNKPADAPASLKNDPAPARNGKPTGPTAPEQKRNQIPFAPDQNNSTPSAVFTKNKKQNAKLPAATDPPSANNSLSINTRNAGVRKISKTQAGNPLVVTQPDQQEPAPVLTALDPAAIQKIQLPVFSFLSLNNNRAPVQEMTEGYHSVHFRNTVYPPGRKPGSLAFSVTPFIAPQFSVNRLKEFEEHNQPGGAGRPRHEQKDDFEREEHHPTAVSAGAWVEADFGGKWGMVSGLSYTVRKIETEPKKIFAEQDNNGTVKYRFNCSSGYTYISPKTGTQPAAGDSINVNRSVTTLRYLGLPLGVRYSISKGKFSLVPMAGVRANFLMGQNLQTGLQLGTNNETHEINEIEGTRKTYFDFFTSLSLEYKLNRKLSLWFSPGANLSLGTVNTDAAVRSYYNSFNTGAGVKIKL